MSVLARKDRTTLVDLLDKILDTGVVVAGDATISVANVGLLFASIRLVLTSTDKAWETQLAEPGLSRIDGPPPPWAHPAPELFSRESEPLPPPGPQQRIPPPPAHQDGGGDSGASSPVEDTGLAPRAEGKQAGNGMAQLVVTIADTLREVLERESLRRLDRGTLTPSEVERLGEAFLRMRQEIEAIKEAFNLKDEDLNLDLGPLGTLR